MIVQLLFIALGVAAVSYGAKILVDGASSLAKRLNVSDLVIGLTIVSFGTSAPELIVSVTAALSGNTDVAIGNVIGSNILNICLILGVCGLITPLVMQRNTVWKEIPLALLGVIVVWLLANDALIDRRPPSIISRSDGWVLLGFFAIFLYYMLEVARNNPENETSSEAQRLSVWAALGLVAAGIGGLTLGGRLIVDNAVIIARDLGVSDALIGLTLVSVGTSIPELATSVVAAMKRNADIAVGNVVGSNIFNTFFILGTSASIAPLPSGQITQVDYGVCIGATLLLFVSCFIFSKRAIYRVEAALFLATYIGYMVYLLV